MHAAGSSSGVGDVADRPAADIRLLGPLEVLGPKGILRLPAARRRALLALLALHAPRVLSRVQLIDALWGTEPPATAVKTLHSHIARVRQALAAIGLDDVLVTREPGYALVLEPRSVDIGRFERHVRTGRQALRTGDAHGAATELRAGLALWHGDPLADCPVADWGQAEIARLIEARVSAAETLAEADLLRGEHLAVASELEHWVARHPLRERFWELLVIAHYRCGRQNEALQTYRRARAVLLDELGVEPGPRLRALEAAVLSGAAELDPASAPVTSPPEPVREPVPQQREGAESRSSALPLPPTSLIGRQRESSDILQLLRRTRLVSLTGPGGCGKTRLALTVAAEVERTSGRPVAMVDLTAIRANALVPEAVANALDIHERPGTDPVETLVEALADSDRFVVLDNCEHLASACADLVSRLLAACPGLGILVTSREALRVAGESAYEVPPLSVPDPNVPRTLAELAVYDSVRLFLDRAADTGAPAFREADAEAIGRLCATLDGLPLAIELAAARTAVLSPAQITQRLRDRFGLLTMGSRSGPHHHRALRATVAWSHDLLTPDEAALFARLGVFAGGFSLEAAEAVWHPDRTLDALTGLLGKSLVRSRYHRDGNRFTMLETIAAYAAEQLAADQDALRDARQRHAHFFLTAAEEADAEPTGVRFADLHADHDNLRLAMSWLAEQTGDIGELRLAAALSRYCHLHGHYRQGRQWLDQALARISDLGSGPRAKALAGAASLALFECDYDQAAAHATNALALSIQLGDHRQIGRTHRLLGSVAREQSRYGEALLSYSASRESFQAAGDHFGVAYSHQLAGATAWLSADLDTARKSLDTSLTMLRAVDDQKGAASSLTYLAAVALYDGDDGIARRLLDEAFDLFGELNFKEGIAWALNILGLLEHHTGNPAKAAPLLDNSLALHRELGDRWRQASVLEAQAAVATTIGDLQRATALLALAEKIRETIKAPVPAIERPALVATRRAVARGC